MTFCRHFALAALLIVAPVALAQWIDPDPSSQGPYLHTPDKVAIGSATAPVKQLEVTGDAGVSGSVSGGKEILVTGWNSAYGRLHAAVPNWIGMTQNTSFEYPNGWVLDDPALPGWFVKLDGRLNVDKFSIYRVPVGAGVHTDEKELFSLGANGATVIGSPTGTGNTLTVNGNTGIGMNNPSTRLEARGAATQYGTFRRVARLWDDSTATAGVGAGIDFIGKFNAAGTYGQFANVKGVKANGVDGDMTGNLVVSVEDSAGNTKEVVRVGPTSFDVTGNANFTGTVTGGNIQAKYQDVAEWVPAIGSLDAGSVVIVAPGQVNSVIASSEPYDSRVAGVISSQPGLILGEAGASKVMVATTGRVRVKVDATTSPISAGDLLVTSSSTGMAMRSEPIDIDGVTIHRPGTVVGKALEPLASGTGEILVLLSLQ